MNNGGLNIQILRGGESKTGINFGAKNYDERLGLYRYFLGILVGPFLEKFGLDADDNCWDENYLAFQSLILNNRDDELFEKYLSENGYEIVGKKTINFKIIMKDGKEILQRYNESGDEFDMKEFLQKSQDGELFFGFLPGEGKSIVVIFAKHKKVDIAFLASIPKLGGQREVDKLLGLDFRDLPELLKPGGPLESFTL